MKLRHGNGWLSSQGPESDIVLSCRARLARNIGGFPFTGRASGAQRIEILALAKRAVLDARFDDTMLWIELNQVTPRDRRLLMERHLISAHLAEGDAPRGVAVSGDESLSIMINEEDHLRMQVLMPGFQLSTASQRIDRVDDALEERLEFSFSERFGFLTACPTNVGTGLRLGVMVHLPALKLTGEIDRVRRAARDLHLAVRGFFGEGSESAGDFYQISNQITLGASERDLLDQFERDIVPQLIEYERAARKVLVERRASLLDDRVHRAMGVLRNARLLGSDEAMKLLSRVRLGVHMGRLSGVDGRAVNELFLQVQPAHLKLHAQAELDADELRQARAALVRERLGG